MHEDGKAREARQADVKRRSCERQGVAGPVVIILRSKMIGVTRPMYVRRTIRALLAAEAAA